MAEITFQGNPIHTNSDLPEVGQTAPNFKLVNKDLENVSLDDFKGRKKLLNIVPSLDTGVCAASTIQFNKLADQIDNAAILTISSDLPFAQQRFCTAEGIDEVTALSMMRSKDFAKDYGVLITDGPLAGLAARAVVVLDENNKVIYTQQVPEIAEEPDYDQAISALR